MSHWVIIIIACVSVVKNIEVLKGVLKNKRELLIGKFILLPCTGFVLLIDVSMLWYNANILLWKNSSAVRVPYETLTPTTVKYNERLIFRHSIYIAGAINY